MKHPVAQRVLERIGLSHPGPGSAAREETVAASFTGDKAEKLIMGGLFAMFLTAYGLTLATGVVPGESAAATASALRLLPDAPVTQPLWLFATRALAALPFFDKVLCLNLFSALCGSLAAALVFMLTKRVIVEFLREPPAIRMVPVGDESSPEVDSTDSDGDPNPIREQHEHLIATFGGIAASVAFAFSAPLWIASVSLHPQSFHTLLALVTVERLARYHLSGRTTTCLAALFLLGLGCVESVFFVALLPFALLAVILASIRHEQICDSFIMMLLLAIVSGAGLNLAILTAMTVAAQPFSSDLVLRTLAALAESHSRSVGEAFPKGGGVFILFQTVVPAPLALLSVKRFTSPCEESARWKWGFLNLFLTGFALACMMNMPNTAWSIAREGSHLPILPALMVAVALGCVLAYWLLLASFPNYDADYELIPPSFNLRLLGYSVCMVICVVLLRLISTNVDESSGRTAAFADIAASEMLRQAQPAQILVTDGTLDLNLLILSALKGHPVHLVSGTPSSAPDAFDQAPKNSAPASGRLSAATASCVRFGIPVDQEPIPMGLLYRGLPAGEDVNCDELVSQHKALWKRVTPLLADDPSLRPSLRCLQRQLREQASRLANDLGVFLESQGRPQDADCAYTAARQADPDNFSASLNRYGLAVHGALSGQKKEAFRQICTFADRPGFTKRFTLEVGRWGKLAAREADTLLPAVLADYDVDTAGAERLFQFCEEWVNAVADTTSPRPSSLSQAVAASLNPQLAQAVSLLLNGQKDRAETLLRYLVTNQPKLLSAWALLAEILMDDGKLQDVARSVLPAMRAAVKAANADDTLIDLTQGCLHMRSDPRDLVAARDCFLRVVSQNPALNVGCEELLRASALSGKADLIEADARTILRLSPGHVTANAILGSLRLGQQRHEESESFLRASITHRPTPGACNDLAELCRRKGRLAEAEQQARSAIRLKPTFYQAWDTLANILQETGHTDEANEALKCALVWGHQDARLYLTLTRLRIRQNRLAEAAHVLDFAQTLAVGGNQAVRDEFDQLRKRLTN